MSTAKTYLTADTLYVYLGTSPSFPTHSLYTLCSRVQEERCLRSGEQECMEVWNYSTTQYSNYSFLFMVCQNRCGIQNIYEYMVQWVHYLLFY